MRSFILVLSCTVASNGLFDTHVMLLLVKKIVLRPLTAIFGYDVIIFVKVWPGL